MHYILKRTIQQVLLISLARYLSVLELLIDTSWTIRRAQLWDPKPVSEHPGEEDIICKYQQIMVDPPANHSCIFKGPSLVTDGFPIQIYVALCHSSPKIDLSLAYQANFPCKQK